MTCTEAVTETGRSFSLQPKSCFKSKKNKTKKKTLKEMELSGNLQEDKLFLCQTEFYNQHKCQCTIHNRTISMEFFLFRSADLSYTVIFALEFLVIKGLQVDFK